MSPVIKRPIPHYHTTLTRENIPARFEPVIPASERPQNHALDGVATGIGWRHECFYVALVLAKERSSQSGCYVYHEKCWTVFWTEGDPRNANVAGPILVVSPSLVDISFPVCRFRFLCHVPWHAGAVAGHPVLYLVVSAHSFLSFILSCDRSIASSTASSPRSAV